MSESCDRLIPSGTIRVTFPQATPGDDTWRHIVRYALFRMARCAEDYLLIHFENGNDGTLYDEQIDDLLCAMDAEQYDKYWYPRVEIIEGGEVLDFREATLVISVEEPRLVIHAKVAIPLPLTTVFNYFRQMLPYDSGDLEIHITGKLSLLLDKD